MYIVVYGVVVFEQNEYGSCKRFSRRPSLSDSLIAIFLGRGRSLKIFLTMSYFLVVLVMMLTVAFSKVDLGHYRSDQS